MPASGTSRLFAAAQHFGRFRSEADIDCALTERAGFRRGLAESGYVEGQNVAVEYRFADACRRVTDLVMRLWAASRRWLNALGDP